MLETIVVNPKDDAEYAIIWLHGLGATGDDFVPIAHQLHQELPLQARFVFPHAPLRPVTLNSGYVMRAWYDILGLDLQTKEDRDGLEQTRQSVEEIIQHQVDDGIVSNRIFLGGFSQGGAAALYTGVRYEQPLAGIIAFSAYMPFYKSIVEEANSANQQTPILFAHGTRDGIVPLLWAELSSKALSQNGNSVAMRTYPIEHQVCQEELVDLTQWLGEVSGK